MARAIAAGCAHQITQRGNNHQDVFFVDEDRRVYLELLKEQAQGIPTTFTVLEWSVTV
jgi:hypothetical protein